MLQCYNATTSLVDSDMVFGGAVRHIDANVLI